jgi:signal transduction histidine kinase
MANVLLAKYTDARLIERDQLEELAASLGRALDEARALSNQLQLVPARPDGLMAALGRLANDTCSQSVCEFVCEEPVLITNPQIALTLYFVAREGVQMALGKRNATRIAISLKQANRQIALSVCDNAPNFRAPLQAGQTNELPRADTGILGGSLASESALNSVTIVSCTVSERKEAAHGCPR